LPAFSCSTAAGYSENTDVTWSPNSALIAGAVPEYGTKIISTSAARLSISNAMRVTAVPPFARVTAPGLARAAFTKSASVRYGDALLTTMSCGVFARRQIDSNPVSGS
jgi:hypothetical protein